MPNATSNSDAIIDGHAARFRKAIERGQVAGAQSLEAFRDAGHELREAKKICPHGTFGRVIARCGCTRAWAARLIKLDEIWNEIPAARAWAETIGRPLRSKEFTVDGAIQLVREYHSMKNGKPANRRRSRNEPSRLKEVLAELANVERNLAAANARIECLEAELSKFSAVSKTERQPPDAETKEKSAKIHAC
jgi:hypothetical protein